MTDEARTGRLGACVAESAIPQHLALRFYPIPFALTSKSQLCRAFFQGRASAHLAGTTNGGAGTKRVGGVRCVRAGIAQSAPRLGADSYEQWNSDGRE